jgi:heterodisulfide reductase subunit A-like polyferredoxin
MYREPNIVTAIKVRRLERTGHLVRMSDHRTIKKVFLVKSDGRRKAERPKLRLLHCNENYRKLKGVKRWRIKAKYRSVWAVILKEALVRL